MKRRLINPKNVPLLATIGLFILMFGIGSATFPGFFSLQNFYYLLIDNAYLIIMAIGMTFVIISGGIDLSVGSLLALTTMMTSSMLEKGHFSPLVVIPLVLLMGLAFGTFQGYLIQTFNMAPFIVTLGGLYLARGLCYVVSIDTIAINHPFFKAVSQLQINVIGNNFISANVVIAMAIIIVGMYLAHYTNFGRTVYAIGGNEQSAVLMGLPVARTKIQIYALSSLFTTISGIAFTFYMRSGYALHGQGMEMDAIASVVIGGTLLTGGVGNVFGTVFGVLIFGTIQSYINFDGNLNAWWTRIVIGMLVFLFCLLQRVFEASRKKTKKGSQDSHPPRPVVAH
ncbi:MAG TPA: sugar ABC transporter permease YjfF [Firmicutes bacterium]|jgi:galactofuranose transport system permease protein|nr:sugar ABC transporter permease YjfF [Bacillota bacterium]